MKKRILYIFYTACLLISSQVILTSSSAGRAFSANDGNTGAPNEPQTCGGCHGTNFTPTVSVNVKDANGVTVTSYTPGAIYTIDFVVNAVGSPLGYGFQMVALDTLNMPINGFFNPKRNSRVITLATGRQYAEHLNTSTSNVFGVSWTAPSLGSGDVIIYGAGAAVNGDGNTSGDGGTSTRITLTENTTVGINTVQSQDEFSIYPNPSTDFILIGNESNQLKVWSIEIINTNGSSVLGQTVMLEPAKTKRIPIVSLSKGIYIVQVRSAVSSFTKKIIIQ